MYNEELLSEFEKRKNGVKRHARESNVPLWMLAAELNVNDGNLSRKLRKLTEIQAKEMHYIIERLSSRKVV